MNAVASHGVTDWREGRRTRAWELITQGWRQRDITAALGVAPGAVEPMADAGQRGGPGRAPAPRGASTTARASPRTAPGTLEALGAGSGGVWLSRGSLDRGPDRRGDSAGLRGDIPSVPCRPRPACLRMEPAENGAARCPAERVGDPPLARRALARGQKRPRWRGAPSSL